MNKLFVHLRGCKKWKKRWLFRNNPDEKSPSRWHLLEWNFGRLLSAHAVSFQTSNFPQNQGAHRLIIDWLWEGYRGMDFRTFRILTCSNSLDVFAHWNIPQDFSKVMWQKLQEIYPDLKPCFWEIKDMDADSLILVNKIKDVCSGMWRRFCTVELFH